MILVGGRQFGYIVTSGGEEYFVSKASELAEIREADPQCLIETKKGQGVPYQFAWELLKVCENEVDMSPKGFIVDVKIELAEAG
jgi:hypothetical protein